MHRRWSAVLTSVIATAAVITGASIVGGEARAGSSDEYVAPASLDCVTPIVVSTTGPTDAESMGGLRFGYGQDMVLTHTMSVALPAGTYEVEASTHDSYSFRADVVAQANEQVRIVASAGDLELAATGFTSDLTDGTFTGWAVSDLGSITLADDADAITIEHFALDHATVGPDSLKVAALCFVPVDGADEAADDDAAGDDAADDAPCPADHDSDDGEDDAGGDADDVATDDADADEAAPEDCDDPASDEPLCDADVTVDGDESDEGDDTDDDTDEAADDTDEAADDTDEASDSCDDPAAEDPADEVPVDEDCIVVDQGDDTDFSGTEDCEDVILIEVCDDHAAEEDADGGDDGTEEPGVDEPAHDCDEPVVDDEIGDDEAGDDDAGDEADEDDAAADDETPDVGDDGSDDSTADDSDDGSDDDGSDDDGSDDSTSDESTGDEPPAGPTTPADADDPEIPLVDTVPNSTDDDTTDGDTTDGDTTDGDTTDEDTTEGADPVQGAVDQQTPGQGGLPVTGATSGILVMLGLSLAIAGFALMGMVGRQYMGGAD